MAWREWLLRAVAGSPQDLQILYGVAGERRLDERELAWLPGYDGAAPVRIGNAAIAQFQLDVYGEVMDTLHLARRAGLRARARTPGTSSARCCEFLEAHWHEPDEGIWEVRGPRRHFTHSKVMAWVAFDRAVKDAERFGLEGPVDDWRASRDEIHARSARAASTPSATPSCSPTARRARRQPAADPAGRLPAAGRPARQRHGRRHRARA